MSNAVVTELIERSHRLGSDPRNTNYAGGNTSAKGAGVDPVTGGDVELLWVKGSGGDLGYAAPEATDDELWAALATVRLDHLVRDLDGGLDTVLSPTTMSGGERQRVALARALVTDAELLLLDEATAQLDGLSEAAVAEGIRRQAATGAVVTIAHRLSTVIDADQIVLLEAGRVRAVGTHEQLLGADELYRELVAALRIATPEPEAVTTP